MSRLPQNDRSGLQLLAAGFLGFVIGAGLATCVSEAPAQEAILPDTALLSPPKRFDKPYEGVLIEHTLPKDQVEQYCAKLFTWFHQKPAARDSSLLGCAVQRADFCVIVYIDKPLGFFEPEVIRRHEIGHCNGWSENHER